MLKLHLTSFHSKLDHLSVKFILIFYVYIVSSHFSQSPALVSSSVSYEEISLPWASPLFSNRKATQIVNALTQNVWIDCTCVCRKNENVSFVIVESWEKTLNLISNAHLTFFVSWSLQISVQITASGLSSEILEVSPISIIGLCYRSALWPSSLDPHFTRTYRLWS